jgi:hypothetical protein
MKCTNPDCNRGIGLVSYRRAWSSRRYCSRQCRDALVTERPDVPDQDRGGTSRFAWLFLPPARTQSPNAAPAVVRVRTR